MGQSKEIRKLYEICHTDYDQHMIKTGHYMAQKKILKQIMDYIDEPILDLACGTGFLIGKLSDNFTAIFGNDFSSSMVTLARGHSNFLITNENAELLESYQEKFKTIISCNLFFYLQDRNKAIKRWKELLEQDGKIIFIEEHPFIKPQSKEMDKHTEKLIALISPISPEDIIDLMTQNGFKLVRKASTKIDDKHNLYALVFSLR